MRIIAAVTLLLLTGAPLRAQDAARPAGPELVDRVAAVVGDTVILLSEIQAELEQLRAGGQLPDDPAAQDRLAREILQSRVNDLILLQAARDAGAVASDANVEQMVEQEINRVRTRFSGSGTSFEDALARSGLTVASYREQLRGQLRDRQLVESFLQIRLRERTPPLISEEQLREAFQAQQSQLGRRPATVSLRQVLIEPQPSDSALAAARAEAEDVLRQLDDGEDFEVLARRFSDDPGTAEQGGDLGWFQSGRMVPEFERAAFALRPGQTSGIVRTDFGFHIIRLERVRGAERKARHILIRPEVTDRDRAEARERADSVAEAIRSGANVTDLARQYETPREQIELPRVPMDQLPPEYSAALADEEAGAVVGPIELESSNGSSWAVVQVTERQPEGEYTLDDVREQLRQRLQEQALIQELIEELEDRVYVSIKL